MTSKQQKTGSEWHKGETADRGNVRLLPVDGADQPAEVTPGLPELSSFRGGCAGREG